MNNYEQSYIRLEEQQNLLLDKSSQLELDLVSCKKAESEFENARDIVSNVLATTQDQVKDYIEEIITIALQSVFGDAYSFKISFEQRRGRSEAEIKIKKGDIELDPRGEVGGGLVDIAALALRLVLWSLRSPRNSPVFLLDEPGKHISVELRHKFGMMLRKFSDMLDTQFIVITQDRLLEEIADCTFTISQENGLSQINRKEI